MYNLRPISFLTFLLLSFCGFAHGQEAGADEVNPNGGAEQENYSPQTPPNTYRSPQNPLYWKNKKPEPGYWQQDVHYQIEANLDDKAHTIDGSEKLTYWNNSPDTLRKVYFHLYQNAFQPGSYYHMLRLANKSQPTFGLYEKQGLGTRVNNLTIDGDSVQTRLDNTILIAELPKPVLPGDSVEFSMDFTTFFGNGSMWRRMKMYKHHGVKHFNAVHWYPRIAVYDDKMGWQTDQHLGKEFYGDFGTFDVSLTLPKEYIVQATGNLVNKDKALPEELRSYIDIQNYEEIEAEEIEQQIEGFLFEKYDSLKTWRYHAENVHDFAFTADPTYRMGTARYNGTRCIALVQAHKASEWLGVPRFMEEVVATYEEQFGPYPYPKVVAADARDGMEYPMVTLCGGTPPDNYALIAHEIGHMWFQSAVGTNEAYRAGMDEGFTQMATSVAMDEIVGQYPTASYNQDWYTTQFQDSVSFRQSEVYTWYINNAVKNQDARLNVHSHQYNSSLGHGGGYRQVYYKMGTMLYNLEYVLGKELFQEAMMNYFKNWQIAHPYPEDFRQSIMDYTGVDLNWFFDQWLETKKTIDYKIKRVQKRDPEGAYRITFERKGAMQMPLAFTVTTKKGEEEKFLIPNKNFVKETNAKVLPKWTGWGKKFNTTYQADIQVDGKIDNVVIDPSNRLADVDKTNNRLKGNVDFQFDSQIDEYNNLDQYELNWRPDIWYNEVDGLKGGIHFDGSYLDYKHQFHLTAWYNSQVLDQFDEEESLNIDDPNRLPVNFNAWYKTPLTGISHDLFIKAGGRILDGLYRGHFGFEKSWGNQDKLDLNFQVSLRPNQEDRDYLLYPLQWETDQWNNNLELTYHHNYNYFNGKGDMELGFQTSALGSDYDFTRLNLTVKNENYLDKLVINTRTHFEYSLGNNIAPQSQLYLAGSRPAKMMDNKFTRSRGFFPNDWLGYGDNTNHFHYGGGLNLRGYAGYLAPFEANNTQYQTFKGTAGGALNAEIEFDQYFNVRLGSLSRYFDFDTYLFGDVGIIDYGQLNSSLDLANARADAGLGTALTIEQWGPLDEANPLTIRFDMPLYLSHIPAVEDNNFDFRWVFGVQRSF